MIKKINNWFLKQSKNILKYSDGFWNIPYLSNSPETIVKSIAKMPFTKHSKSKKYILSKTPFIKGEMFYEEIEDGLWLIHSELSYKASISYVKTSDENMSSDWYLLSFTAFGIDQRTPLIDGVAYSNYSWLLYKPKAWATSSHFKGSKEIGFTYYFNDYWLKNTLYKQSWFANSPIKDFFENDAQYIIWADKTSNFKPIYEHIYNTFRSELEDKKALINKQSMELIHEYVNAYQPSKTDINIFNVSDKVRLKIHKAEKLMLSNLMKPFMGIDAIAKEVGISQTGLKTNFKLMYNTSVFKYFREKQMILAKEALIQNNIEIKELSGMLGYENRSKFSAAFKEVNGTLPSEVV